MHLKCAKYCTTQAQCNKLITITINQCHFGRKTSSSSDESIYMMPSNWQAYLYYCRLPLSVILSLVQFIHFSLAKIKLNGENYK